MKKATTMKRAEKIKKGKNYLSANIKGRSIDVNKVIKYGNDILKPAGFSKRTERKYDNGDIVLYWLNVKDGGYVSLTVSPQDFIGIFYVSGCRPTDGTTMPSPSLTPKKTWSRIPRQQFTLALIKDEK